MAPSDENELTNCVATTVNINNQPSAFRYPRGEGVGVKISKNPELWKIGKGRIVKQGSKVCILSLGTRLQDSLDSANKLASYGLSTTVADARFAKPIDEELIAKLAKDHEILISVEEGSIGGFSAQVMSFLTKEGLLDNGLKFRPLFFPDIFIPHGKPDKQNDLCGINANQITDCVLKALGLPSQSRESRETA